MTMEPEEGNLEEKFNNDERLLSNACVPVTVLCVLCLFYRIMPLATLGRSHDYLPLVLMRHWAWGLSGSRCFLPLFCVCLTPWCRLNTPPPKDVQVLIPKQANMFSSMVKGIFA